MKTDDAEAYAIALTKLTELETQVSRRILIDTVGFMYCRCNDSNKTLAWWVDAGAEKARPTSLV